MKVSKKIRCHNRKQNFQKLEWHLFESFDKEQRSNMLCSFATTTLGNQIIVTCLVFCTFATLFTMIPKHSFLESISPIKDIFYMKGTEYPSFSACNMIGRINDTNEFWCLCSLLHSWNSRFYCDDKIKNTTNVWNRSLTRKKDIGGRAFTDGCTFIHQSQTIQFSILK